MNHFFTSTGERVSKSTIDRRVRDAKETVLGMQLSEYGYNFCFDCGKVGVRLDCSHTVSVNDCQRNRETEKAWSLDNIKVRCRDCHSKLDKNNVQLNFN